MRSAGKYQTLYLRGSRSKKTVVVSGNLLEPITNPVARCVSSMAIPS